jgi:hypothetical protein
MADIAEISKIQLRDRQRRAMHWNVQVKYEETTDREGDPMAGIVGPGVPEWHLVCAADGQSITRLVTGGAHFITSLASVRDRLVAHIAQCHEGVDDDDRTNYNLAN